MQLLSPPTIARKVEATPWNLTDSLIGHRLIPHNLSLMRKVGEVLGRSASEIVLLLINSNLSSPLIFSGIAPKSYLRLQCYRWNTCLKAADELGFSATEGSCKSWLPGKSSGQYWAWAMISSTLNIYICVRLILLAMERPWPMFSFF